MIIPREGDKIRIYIQLSNQDIIDSSTGRVDRSKIGPEELLEVSTKPMVSSIGKFPDCNRSPGSPYSRISWAPQTVLIGGRYTAVRGLG